MPPSRRQCFLILIADAALPTQAQGATASPTRNKTCAIFYSKTNPRWLKTQDILKNEPKTEPNFKARFRFKQLITQDISSKKRTRSY